MQTITQLNTRTIGALALREPPSVLHLTILLWLLSSQWTLINNGFGSSVTFVEAAASNQTTFATTNFSQFALVPPHLAPVRQRALHISVPHLAPLRPPPPSLNGRQHVSPKSVTNAAHNSGFILIKGNTSAEIKQDWPNLEKASKGTSNNTTKTIITPNSGIHTTNTKILKVNLNKESYSKDELEMTLKSHNTHCGRVPLFEKLYRRSVNESIDIQPTSDIEGGDFRILHGLDSLVGEWPWIVRIQECREPDNCGTCTGTLLNSRWVITAGHCGFGREKNLQNYKATFGLYDLVSPDSISFVRSFDKIIVHPDYNDLNNDVMLARLSEPVEFNDYIQPACFVHATRNILKYTRGKKCYTVGYGLTDQMEDALRLQKLQIQPRLPRECNQDKLGVVNLRRGTLCIGPPEGQIGGSCKGDSGGPDLCYDPMLDSWVLIGTVSYGPSICDRQDGDKWLTVSVDLSNYRTWILTTILKNS